MGNLPKLGMPREKAESKLQVRIEVGKRMLGRECASQQELDQLWRDYAKWSDYNRTLLLAMFSDNQQAERYGSPDPLVTMMREPSYSEQLKHTFSSIEGCVGFLEALLEQLELFELDAEMQSATDLERARTQRDGLSAGEDRPSVFMCHNHEDKEFARRLAQDLESNGARVWVDEAELKIGDPLLHKIADAVAKTDFLGVILSCSSVASPWVQKELRLAMTKEIQLERAVVLPILKERCRVPDFLTDKVYANFTEEKKYEEEFRKLLVAIGIEPTATRVEQLLEPEEAGFLDYAAAFGEQSAALATHLEELGGITSSFAESITSHTSRVEQLKKSGAPASAMLVVARWTAREQQTYAEFLHEKTEALEQTIAALSNTASAMLDLSEPLTEEDAQHLPEALGSLSELREVTQDSIHQVREFKRSTQDLAQMKVTGELSRTSEHSARELGALLKVLEKLLGFCDRMSTKLAGMRSPHGK